MFNRDKRQKNLRPVADICTDGGMQNATQTILANIRFSGVDKSIRVLGVTSSVPNEGKSTAAIALAIAIGKGGESCLLIEGDMRRRSLSAALGARARHGLYALVAGKCGIEDAVVPTRYKNVSFIDAEAGIPSPDMLLSSASFHAMLQKLAAQFSYIIIDTPPVAAFADASIVASAVEGTLLVVRLGYTDRREVDQAVEQLRASGGSILGIVVNGLTDGKMGSYGYSYYSDYYSSYYSEDGSRSRKSRQGLLGRLQRRNAGGIRAPRMPKDVSTRTFFGRETSRPRVRSGTSQPLPARNNGRQNSSSAGPARLSGSQTPTAPLNSAALPRVPSQTFAAPTASAVSAASNDTGQQGGGSVYAR